MRFLGRPFPFSAAITRREGVLQELVRKLTREDDCRSVVQAALKDLKYRVLASEKPNTPAVESGCVAQTISH